MWLSQLGIGIESNAAGVGIPSSSISVRYRSIPVPDWIPVFRHRTASGIGIFIHSGTGLTGCRTFRHSGILKHCMKDTPSTSTVYCWRRRWKHPVRARERVTPCTSSLLEVERDTPCTSTLHAAERDTPSRLRRWLWKGIQSHVHTAGGGKGYNLTSTLLTEERDTLTSSMMTVERDTISRPHCWWRKAKGYTLTFTL